MTQTGSPFSKREAGDRGVGAAEIGEDGSTSRNRSSARVVRLRAPMEFFDAEFAGASDIEAQRTAARSRGMTSVHAE